jgi:2-polyprenyl-6-hydroxyphenyl methylase/3-demethylubiquinone-9 3-methyltransferase
MDISGYRYRDSTPSCSHDYLLPAVRRELAVFFAERANRRVFDLGCGNGHAAATLTSEGFEVAGVDPSTEGIAQAKGAHSHLRLDVGSTHDDLVGRYGRFPVVISLEVIEHVYAPRDFARTLFDLVEPGGMALLSTPYHGYWKNLALALTGKLDDHFTALWDHGHIKFWSVRTLRELLLDAGFRDLRFLRVGRVPILAKSIVAIARKMGG